MPAAVEDIQRAVDRLKRGGVVAFPTETVYGLAADARLDKAIRAVFEIKGRPSDKPLTLHVSSLDMALPLASHWSAHARRLAEQFWPGPLTIVLPAAAGISPLITAHGTTIGLRCPDHPVALVMIEGLGAPVVGPSANRSGAEPPTTAQGVRSAFPDHPDLMILDGGPCRSGVASTVLSFAQDPPRILRLGDLGPEQLGIG